MKQIDELNDDELVELYCKILFLKTGSGTPDNSINVTKTER